MIFNLQIFNENEIVLSENIYLIILEVAQYFFPKIY